MQKGDIAFKSNFATLDLQTNVVVSRRADRHFEDIGPILCDYLTANTKLPSFPDYEVTVKYATEHRCGVRLRGKNLSCDITGTDPLKDNKKLVLCEANDKQDADAVMTSQIVNELSKVFHDLLVAHPINKQREEQGKPLANCVLLRGAGVRIDVQGFYERHQMKGFMIAPTAIIAGLGMSIDLDVKPVKGATGDYHTNLDAKADAFMQYITATRNNGEEEVYDFGFLHIKAVDDASHDGNIEMKCKFISKADDMLGKIIKQLQEYNHKQGNKYEYAIVVTGDHTTPLLYGDHSDEPVPFLMCKIDNITNNVTSGEQVDQVQAFSEIDAAQGVLGRFPGGQVFNIIKSYHMQAQE